MKAKITTLLIAFTLVFTSYTRADEGMWLITLLDELNMGKMTEYGLELSAEEIYSLNQPSVAHAVVSMGGGFCTGEIVSDQGLLFTNYHCGRGFVRNHSSVEHDYLKDGFWAMSKEEELPNPGLFVRFLVSFEDVTREILKGVKESMTEEERAQQIASVRRELEAEATEGNHYTARVYSFFGGNNYYLVVYESFNDVRLVGAPPKSIGEFGGDTDNWEWPRHTGDFSIFRVYMGPDGKPAQFAEENIPLKPRHHLPISLKGVEKDDFAMTLGYGGRTTRYMTSWEIEESMTITHPNRAKLREIVQDIWLEDMVADQAVYIKYFSKHNGSANYWKNSIGMMEAINKLNVKARKEKIEAQFTEWVNANKKRTEKYGEALSLIQEGIESRAKTTNINQYLNECFGQGTELTIFALGARNLVNALEGGDEEAIRKAADNFLARADGFYNGYNAPTDRKTTAAMFSVYKEDIDKAYWPDFFNTVDEKYNGNMQQFVDEMFETSVFTSREKLEAFLKDPSMEALNKDLAYLTGQDVMALFQKVNSEAPEDARGKIAKGHRLYIAGLREMDPDLVRYPDANSTMRLSYGTVLPYEPRDAVIYEHYTTGEGILEKYQPGHHEFDVKEKQLELLKNEEYGIYADKDGYLPVCFLTTNDITGGNSGSPVINGKGELIGIAFDGNWEALSGDIVFEDELQRCINVDIRYVLWVIDVFAGADHLIDEMTLVR